MLETGVRPDYQASLQRLNDGLRITLYDVAVHLRSLRPNPYALILLAVATLEAMLGVRLWIQLTSQADTGLARALMTITGPLVAPFRGFDVASTRPTGIFEFATLAAMEAVLVAAIAAIVVLFVGGNLVRGTVYVVSRPRRSASVDHIANSDLSTSGHPQSQAMFSVAPDAADQPSDD